MTDTETLSLPEIETLARSVLLKAGASAAQADPLAKATIVTEAIGVASHGLAYIPTYAEHVNCGKVDGQAAPVLSRPRPGVLTADAATEFAHAALDTGLDALIPTARELGGAVLAIKNSYNSRVLGVHTQRLAQAGLLGLGFTNAPASIAPLGGATSVLVTNPISVAAPDGA